MVVPADWYVLDPNWHIFIKGKEPVDEVGTARERIMATEKCATSLTIERHLGQVGDNRL